MVLYIQQTLFLYLNALICGPNVFAQKGYNEICTAKFLHNHTSARMLLPSLDCFLLDFFDATSAAGSSFVIVDWSSAGWQLALAAFVVRRFGLKRLLQGLLLI